MNLPGRGEQGATRVETALYKRCRRGNPEALSTLLYRLVDRLYTAASFVCPDEDTAVLMVAGTWEDLLLLLQRPRVGGRLRTHVFSLLRIRLLDIADPAMVAHALRSARYADQEAVLPFPEGDLPALLNLIPMYSGQLAAAYHLRHRREKQLLAGLLVILFLIVALRAWPVMQGRSGNLRLACLRDRIVKRDLITAVRDSLAELPDPAGADAYEARALQRVLMALEELANAGASQRPADLRYLKARLRQEDLAATLAMILQEREGLARKELAQAQLVLEEVQSL